MRSSFIIRSLHFDVGTTVGMRCMPEGPVRRFRRCPVVRGRGSKRFFFFLSSSPPPLAVALVVGVAVLAGWVAPHPRWHVSHDMIVGGFYLLKYLICP